MGRKDQEEYLVQSDTSAVSTKVTSIRQTNYRWLALLFACCIMIGSYMCYDFPQNLENQIESANGLDLNENQVNMFYTVYSFPNIILPLIGGYLIDAIGIRKGIFVFTLVLVLGQAICTVGVMDSVRSYAVVIVGRVVFGLTGESLSVTQSTIVSQWFHGKELSFALGLNISVSRFGSIMSSFLFPAIYSATNELFVPLLIGVIVCAVSWGTGICLNIMDRYADKQEGKEEVKLSEDDKIKMSDLKELGLSFWIISISCILSYACFFPFMQTLQKYLIAQFGVSEDHASNYLSIPYFISAGCTPFFGLLVDRIGKRGIILFASTFILISVHISILIVPQCGDSEDPTCISYWFILPLTLLGIYYSIYAAVLWPCVPLVCEAKVVGTAFGIINCIQNGGLAIVPLITGAIISGTSKDHGYFWNQIFFIIVASATLVVNFFIYFIDIRGKQSLHKAFQAVKEENEEGNQQEEEVNQARRSLAAKRSFAH